MSVIIWKPTTTLAQYPSFADPAKLDEGKCSWGGSADRTEIRSELATSLIAGKRREATTMSIPGDRAAMVAAFDKADTDRRLQVLKTPDVMLPVLRNARYESSWTPRRSARDWKKARETGDIIINPLSRIHVEVMDDYYIPSYVQATIEANHDGLQPHLEWWAGRFGCARQLYRCNLAPDDFNVSEAVMAQRTSFSVPGRLYYFSGNPPVERVSDRFNTERLAEYVAAKCVAEPRNTDLLVRGFSETSAATMDLLTELAELPETLKMIYNAVKWGMEKTREFRSKEAALRAKQRRAKNPVHWREIQDEIASLWMNYRYGLGPIAYSISDALDYLERRGAVYATTRLGVNGEVNYDLHGWKVTIPYRDRFWGKTQVDLSSSLKHIQMNFLKTLWEIKSLSFVWGWFINVGDTLSALQPPQGARQVKYTYSRQIRWNGMAHHESGHSVPLSVNIYKRDILNQGQGVGLVWNPNLNLKRALDAMALSWFSYRNQRK